MLIKQAKLSISTATLFANNIYAWNEENTRPITNE